MRRLYEYLLVGRLLFWPTRKLIKLSTLHNFGVSLKNMDRDYMLLFIIDRVEDGVAKKCPMMFIKYLDWYTRILDVTINKF